MKPAVVVSAVCVALVMGAMVTDAHQQDSDTQRPRAGREIAPEHVSVPDGYRIETVVANLSVPHAPLAVDR
jgi:hypothetical protein